MTDNKPDAEAIYTSVLPLLDGLPTYRDRALLVLNFVKYVMMIRAEQACPEKTPDILQVFRVLSLEFAMQVVSLPDRFDLELEHDEPCGECAKCKAADLGQVVPKGETVN